MTIKPKGFKPKKGEYYNVIFKGIDVNDNPLLDICKPYSRVSEVDCESEFKETMRNNIIDFAKERFSCASESCGSGSVDPEIIEIEHSSVDSISIGILDELLLLLELSTEMCDDINLRYRKYEALSLISLLTRYAGRHDYYKVCADYQNCIISVSDNLLEQINEPQVSDMICNLGNSIDKTQNVYGRVSLSKIKDISILLSCLQGDVDLSVMQSFINSQDHTVSELSRLFMVISLLSPDESVIKEQFTHKAQSILGCKVASKEKINSIYFGMEGTTTEFKTSAYESADNATEEQPLILAKTIAAFMNTDGGTLYIGVNDLGYCSGMNSDLSYTNNSIDRLLRDVPKRIFSYLGTGSDWNRYMEYIKFGFMKMPANDTRIVMAFCVPAMSEPVYVKGEIYTRSGSRTIIKRSENMPDFLRGRQSVGEPVTRQPEFPCYLNDENVWCFPPLSPVSIDREPERKESVVAVQTILESESNQEFSNQSTAVEQQSLAAIDKASASQELRIDFDSSDMVGNIVVQNTCDTQPDSSSDAVEYKENGLPSILSYIRCSNVIKSPLSRAKSQGFTESHVFLHISEKGQIAASQNINTDRFNDGCSSRMICSFDTSKKDIRLLSLYSDCSVSIGTLKPFAESKNCNRFHKLFDADSLQLLFMAPVKRDYFLLIVVEDKSGVRFFRTVDLSRMQCGVKPAGNRSQILDPAKFKVLHAEVMTPEIVNQITDQFGDVLDDNFAIHQGGRYWEKGSERMRQQVDALRELCCVEI